MGRAGVKRPRRYRLAFLLGLAFTMPPVAAPADAIPPVLQKNVACMAEVLRFMVGVDHIKIGIDSGRNFPFHTDEKIDDVPWRRPYLQYHFVMEDGRDGTVRANIERSRIDGPESYSYEIYLNGLGDSPDLGTLEAHQRWKAQCGVDVSAMYE